MKRFLRSGVTAAARRLERAALLSVLVASVARAEDAKPVRVGASHRVDVIAPGERVETAIDRMRRNLPPARELIPRATPRLAPRLPTERVSSEHGAPERGSAERGSDRPADAAQKQGATPSPSGTQGPPRR
jgi:hypothetical protein